MEGKNHVIIGHQLETPSTDCVTQQLRYDVQLEWGCNDPVSAPHRFPPPLPAVLETDHMMEKVSSESSAVISWSLNAPIAQHCTQRVT